MTSGVSRGLYVHLFIILTPVKKIPHTEKKIFVIFKTVLLEKDIFNSDCYSIKFLNATSSAFSKVCFKTSNTWDINMFIQKKVLWSNKL